MWQHAELCLCYLNATNVIGQWISIGEKMTVFWDVAPCSLVEVYQRFRGAYCFHHQGDDMGYCRPHHHFAQMILWQPSPGGKNKNRICQCKIPEGNTVVRLYLVWRMLNGFPVTTHCDSQIAGGGDGLQIWNVTVNVLNKHSGTADKEWSSSLGVVQSAKNSKMLHRALHLVAPATTGNSCKNSILPSVSWRGSCVVVRIAFSMEHPVLTCKSKPRLQ
jgi:hypothetical protein